MARGAQIGRRLALLVTGAVWALAALAPGVAMACPACIGNQRSRPILNLVGIFLLVPFALCVAVVFAIRRARLEASDPAPPADSAIVAGDGATAAPR